MTDHFTALTDAYHAIFDVKDKQPQNSSSRYLAYEALAKLFDLMTTLGWDPPKRFDNEGRKDGHEPFLTLTEADAVEVYGALALAAQIYATTGDRVLSAHYGGLNAILQERDASQPRVKS